MQIGEIIRNYRKRLNMTQEEMANCLGVTAPAVNKWENSNSLPDIMLLAPIARLLNISLDTLLSFEEELTDEEINHIIHEMDSKLKNEPYEEVFQWAKGTIEQYPNCEPLILQLAMILDASRLAKDIPDSEKYEGYIKDWYLRALGSEDEDIRYRAADSLFGFYLRKGQYENAEEYLKYLSNQDPERKRKQAFIYSKTNRVYEAYRAYEELLFSGYQMMSMVFQSIYVMAMQENDRDKAHMLVEKQRELAKVFEMGKYHEASCGLELATAEKDVEATLKTVESMLANVDKICDFTKSHLYEHMEFKEPEETFVKELYKNLLINFKDEETFSYMKENKRWQEFIERR